MKKRFLLAGFMIVALIAAVLANGIYASSFLPTKTESLNNAGVSEGQSDKGGYDAESVSTEKDRENTAYGASTPLEEERVDFPGKIAVIAAHRGGDDSEEYWAAQALVKKYGADKIKLFEANNAFSDGIMATVMKIADNPDVKGLVITEPAYDSADAINSLREKRDDVFVTCTSLWENQTKVADKADLILNLDHIGMGRAIAHQAKAMGAKTLVHYSCPRHMDTDSGYNTNHLYRRMLMKKTCEEIGVQFVYALIPDYQGNAGRTGAEEYVTQDIPKKIEKYGKDTAFFCTEIFIQSKVLSACIDEGGIFTHPIYPQWQIYANVLDLRLSDNYGEYDGNPTFNFEYYNSEIEKELSKRGLSGRYSNWSIAPYYFLTQVGVEYTANVLNGEVQRDNINTEVLKRIMKDLSGTEGSVSVYANENEVILQNCLLIQEGYLVYK